MTLHTIAKAKNMALVMWKSDEYCSYCTSLSTAKEVSRKKKVDVSNIFMFSCQICL